MPAQPVWPLRDIPRGVGRSVLRREPSALFTPMTEFCLRPTRAISRVALHHVYAAAGLSAGQPANFWLNGSSNPLVGIDFGCRSSASVTKE